MNKKIGWGLFLIVFLILMNINIIIGQFEDYGGGNQNMEIKTYSTDKYLLFSYGSRLTSISKQGDLLWSLTDENNIIDFIPIDDLNSDGYNEILISSQNFITPSTRILDGKTGEIFKIFTFFKKTYKNNYPIFSTKIIENNNKIYLSNFNRIYKLSGQDIEKKIEIPEFIKDFEFVEGSLIISTPLRLISYNSNFEKINEEDFAGKGNSFLFGDNYLISYLKDRQGENSFVNLEIYNSNLKQINKFSIPIPNMQTNILTVGDKIILKKGNDKIEILDINGNSIEEIQDMESFSLKEKKIFFIKEDYLNEISSSDTISKNNISIILEKENKISSICEIDENFIIIFNQEEIKIYKNKQSFNRISLSVSPKKTKNIDETDFIIEDVWPFKYNYGIYSDDLSNLTFLNQSFIKKIKDLGDINNDGVNEILIGFETNKNYLEGDIFFTSLAIIFPKTGRIKGIKFIPTPEELVVLIQNLENQINSINNEVDEKQNQIDLKNSEHHQLQINLSEETNETKMQEIQNQINSLESEKNNLQTEIYELQDNKYESEREKEKLENENLEHSLKIKIFTNLNDKLFLILNSFDGYSVDFSTFEKNKINTDDRFYYEGLENIGDINNNGKDDVLLIPPNGEIKILDGENYNTIWTKSIREELELDEDEMIYVPIQSDYKVEDSIIFSAEHGEGDNKKQTLIKLKTSNGELINKKNFENLEFLFKKENILFYKSWTGGIQNLLLVKKTKNIVLDFILARYNFNKDYIVLFDCNEDNKKDILIAEISRGVYSDSKIYCIDTDDAEILKEEIIKKAQKSVRKGVIIHGYEKGKISNLKEIKLMNNFLLIKNKGESGEDMRDSGPDIEGNLLIDLTDFKIKVISQEELSYLEGKIYSKTNKEIIEEEIIASPSNGQRFEGDFTISFLKEGFKMIFVDEIFYTSTNQDSEIIKLSNGEHEIKVLVFDSETEVSYVDFLNIEINRQKSIIPYIVGIILFMFLIIGGILKWKKMRR